MYCFIKSREELETREEFMGTVSYLGKEELAIDQITCFEKNWTFFVIPLIFLLRQGFSLASNSLYSQG